MGKLDPRVTAYLARAPAFARPILKELRAAWRAGCPAAEETLKWGMPSYVHHGILGGFAAFKAHCALWLWRGRHLRSLGAGRGGAMGQFGRITSRADLPARQVLVRLVAEAAALNEARAARPRTRRAAGPGRVTKEAAPEAKQGTRQRARADLKTRRTDASVASFLAGVPDEVRRKDAVTVCGLLSQVSQEPPRMWGRAIVGFGSRRLVYASGRELDWMLVGFSPRKANTVLYLSLDGFGRHAALLARLGKHKTGMGCLYIGKLSDIDLGVLKQLVAEAVRHARQRRPRPSPQPSRSPP